MASWRVKAHGIQVVKLFYLSKKEFLFLKELRDRFVGRLLGEGKGPGEAKTPPHSKNRWLLSPLRDVLSPGIENPASRYEPSMMWNTRDSFFWSWRRVDEYFRDLCGTDHQEEVHELMTS